MDIEKIKELDPNMYLRLKILEINKNIINLDEEFGKNIIVLDSGHGGGGWNLRKLTGYYTGDKNSLSLLRKTESGCNPNTINVSIFETKRSLFSLLFERNKQKYLDILNDLSQKVDFNEYERAVSKLGE